MNLNDPKSIRIKIMDFLSRREHSKKEILNKMHFRVENMEMLIEQVDILIQEGLISDKRFAENYFYHRKSKGYGPLRIKMELHKRGVKESYFDEIDQGIDWEELALSVLKKKIKGNFPEDSRQRLKLKKFLNYRGFEFNQIDEAFSKLKIEDLY
tara:strand:+ start:71423 stop:71884 length:462 start_codon:yes stop_codon:yes gene_type:complete